jgi:CubicO group peptidase (beta-lactamase class C family)
MKWTSLLSALPGTQLQSAFSGPGVPSLSMLTDRLFAYSPRFSLSTAGAVLSPAVLSDIQKIVDERGLPGVSLAVVRRGGAQEFASFGVRTEDGDAMTADVRRFYSCSCLTKLTRCAQTLITIASCSKAFLTAAMGLLMADYAHGRNTTPLPAGLTKLDWDTKLADALPGEWALMDAWAMQKASLKDILSHTSGLPRCVAIMCGGIKGTTSSLKTRHFILSRRYARKHPASSAPLTPRL